MGRGAGGLSMSDLRQNSFVRSGLDGAMAQNGRDPIIPRFYMEAVHDQVASEHAGRAIFRDEERVELIIPGGLNQPVKRVTDEHRRRWPEQYKAFKAGTTQSADGTPIEQWALLSRAQVAELKALNIHTVEACAAINDSDMHRLPMGARAIRNAAQIWLDDSKAMALTSQLSAQNERLETRVAELEALVRQQADMMTQWHTQRMQMADAPNALQAMAPMQVDPLEALRQAAPMEAPAASSLDGLEMMRRRPGRPRKEEAEAAA